MPLLVKLISALVGLSRFLTVFFSTIWTKFSVFLLFVIPSILKSLLALLGIGIVTFTGFFVAINALQDWILESFNNLASDLLIILMIMKLDIGLSIMFSAMSIAIGIKSLRGAFTSFRPKPSLIA